jgi:hypothetical protein
MLALGKTSTRSTGFVAFTTKYGAADLWLERNLIVLTAVIANYLEFLGSVTAGCRFLRSAVGTSLR